MREEVIWPVEKRKEEDLLRSVVSTDSHEQKRDGETKLELVVQLRHR